MLTYEICKKLKDAGFQYPWMDGRYYYLGDGTKILFDRIKDGLDENGMIISYAERLTNIPSLSELIAACGDDFNRLINGTKSRNGWFADGFEKDGMTSIGEGDTPEEAVANLYLQIHDQKS